MRSILLIDDTKAALDQLAASLINLLPETDIRKWVPTHADSDPRATFHSMVDEETTLVITDFDLTSQGQTGLFGASVVAWCQQIGVPVGDYSRKVGSLPKEPELFELRVALDDPEEAARYIAGIFKGFRDIGDALMRNGQLLELRSPAAVLAEILGEPEVESQLALYAGRMSAASGALMDQVQQKNNSPKHKRQLLCYIAGHLLLHVLRFPGPILSLRALKAYVASEEADAAEVLALFEQTHYLGPFADLDQYFWLRRVDEVLDELVKSLPAEFRAETSGELHREAIENRLTNRRLERHGCSRCEGKNGGFFCPFTSRTVCQLSECSVGSNSWLPQGARLCRIERDFFDEWAPILGI